MHSHTLCERTSVRPSFLVAPRCRARVSFFITDRSRPQTSAVGGRFRRRREDVRRRARNRSSARASSSVGATNQHQRDDLDIVFSIRQRVIQNARARFERRARDVSSERATVSRVVCGDARENRARGRRGRILRVCHFPRCAFAGNGVGVARVGADRDEGEGRADARAGRENRLEEGDGRCGRRRGWRRRRWVESSRVAVGRLRGEETRLSEESAQVWAVIVLEKFVRR